MVERLLGQTNARHHKKDFQTMIDLLSLVHLSQTTKLPCFNEKGLFVLHTCQRTLIIGLKKDPLEWIPHTTAYESLKGKEAYTFLLETICGLKSKLQGENEIAGQFKKTFKNYLRDPQKNIFLVSILEKLFKDAKEIKTDYLSQIGQHSYSALAKKILQQNSSSKDVLIIGSGALSLDLIKVLNKKFNLSLSARNGDRTKVIHQDFGIPLIEWGDTKSYQDSHHIINTIGANDTLFDESFFMGWHKAKHKESSPKLFIDLGHPSVIDTELSSNDGVYRLSDIFQRGVLLNQEKSLKIQRARKEISQVVERRFYSFSFNYPFGWEELHFA